MEEKICITLIYNEREIKLELPDTYDKFINLLEDKLYLTPQMVASSNIYYQDKDGDKCEIHRDNYNESFDDCNGIFEMKLNFDNKGDKIIFDNKRIIGNELKNLENTIAKKFSKILVKKLKEKDLEHKNEISSIKTDFQNTLNTIIQKTENKYNELSDYYNEKMKTIFQEYNELIIEKINKGISGSDLNKLAEKFINDNQIINNDNEEKFTFSRVINK